MKEYVIKDTARLLDALKTLNSLSDSGLTLFVLNSKEQVIGSITDGDIRRRLIGGGDLSDSVSVVMQRDFSFFSESDENNVEKFKSFKKRGLRVVPILSNDGRLTSILDLSKYKSHLPIDAVLMAGGKGERLRPLTEKVPKPLLPVGNKAIVDYNVDQLLVFGIKHLYITVNYLKEQIEEHFRKERDGVKIRCIREPYFLGTIGSIQFIETFKNDTILIMNSDLFTNIDYEDFYLHFKQHDADMSIAAMPYDISVPYGIFELEGRDIKAVKEKPTYNYYANAGIYLVKRKLLEMIPKDIFFNATDFVELLINKQMKVIRYPLVGYWIDIGKHEDYKKAQELAKHMSID